MECRSSQDASAIHSNDKSRVVNPTPYENALGISSQFYHCALPLRLDAYSRCQFGCRYCFASRAAELRPESIRLARPASLARHLDGIQVRAPRSVIEEFLAHRQPIHFGGMSHRFRQWSGFTAYRSIAWKF